MTLLTEIDLVLASTSIYRRDLLLRLTPRLRQIGPDVDETPLPGETPAGLAARLAQAKAQAVARDCHGAVVIGSDQVADRGGRIVGKPGTHERACDELLASSGLCIDFHTAVCVIDTRQQPARNYHAADITTVQFRKLDRVAVERYLERERPLDCAGSFKAEGLGIALFESIHSQDPTALIGLPLIAVCRLLREAEIDCL